MGPVFVGRTSDETGPDESPNESQNNLLHATSAIRRPRVDSLRTLAAVPSSPCTNPDEARMPAPSDTSPKALFNKFKSRTEGGDVAAFLVQANGTLEIIEPSKAKTLTPQKLKARLSGKGIAGFFYKGNSGPVFNVVAGKKGGKTGQPWVKYNLRAALSVSNFEVQTDPGADLEDTAPTQSPTIDKLSLLDGLEDTSEEETVKEESPLSSLDVLDEPDEDVEDHGDLSLLDGLDEEEEQETPLLIHKGKESFIQEELDRIEQLKGDVPEDMPDPDEGLVDVLRTNKMFEVGGGVHAPMNWEDVSKGKLDVAKERLAFERKATAFMRGNLTKSQNSRTGLAKTSVENNSKMALGLASILEKHPELLGKGGLLNRIVGPVKGQGQHDKNDSAKTIADRIRASAGRMQGGDGEGEDGNLVLQFIGCFTDGLTEVIEGEKTPIEQFDTIWGELCVAFDVAEENRDALKKSLLARVRNYKAIAGGRSDTLSGKGGRKSETRKGINPEDPRQRITEHDALIQGDISGSVHSCFLAYELAGTLQNPSGLQEEQDVLLSDKGLINGRVADALALTAGGRKLPGKIAKENDPDLVFHTAYEMLNGLRGITGAPKLTQDQATKVMEAFWKGQTYTSAIEGLFPDKRFGWMPTK